MSLDINLLHQHKTSKFIQKAVFVVRMTTIALGLLVLSTLLLLFFLKKNIERTINKKTVYHNETMARIAKNQDKEASILLLNQKYKEIERLLKSEPPLTNYYETLINELPNASESGKLTGLTIQKKGSVTAQISFPNMLAMTKFLSKLESEDFREHFTSVKTSSIAFTGDEGKELFFTLDVQF